MGSRTSAIVPIKEHSERIPRKNFKSLNGRPLYHWILHVLDHADAIDEVVVDTDSPEIADAATGLIDCRIVERPEDLRGDDVPMNDVLLHDVSVIDAEVYFQTHCTNPLLRPSTVDDAVETFLEISECDSLFGVTELQTRLWDSDAEPINHRRDELLPTQELPPVYEENSNVYVFTESSICKRGNRIGGTPSMYPIDPAEAVDIDEPIDFQFAEFLHEDCYGESPSVADLRATWDVTTVEAEEH